MPLVSDDALHLGHGDHRQVAAEQQECSEKQPETA